MLTQTQLAGMTRIMPVATSLQFSPEQIMLLRQTFPGLDEVSLASLASITRERTVPAGAYLCREGQIENAFYLICAGRVMISQNLEKDTSRTLATRGPGELVGELSLLIKDQPCTADVITAEKTTVLEMEQAQFLKLLQRSPSIVLAILRVLADRQRESDRQTMTDLRQKYTELAQAYRKLKEETGRRAGFLTAVTHELRTPLTVIKGYLSLLRAGAISGEALPQVIQAINTNLDTIMCLVNNILLLQEAGLVAPEFRATSVGDVLNTLVSSLRSSGLPEGLILRTEISADLPSTRGDPNGLRHAFSAILDNAVKFTPEGGEIVVRAQVENGTINVQICDPGIGIAPDMLPHIFDFHHLDTTGAHLFGGIGLGLPLAKAIIEQHQGAIQIESEPGHGSTLSVTLPVQT